MFAAYGELLEQATTRELYENPQYAPYLADMEMCINRAISRMQSMGLVGIGRHALTGAVVTGSVATFNLSALSDLVGVIGVVQTDDTGCWAHGYQWAGGTTLVVPQYSSAAAYELLYRRQITPLAPMSDDDTVIPLPDGLAVLLPYYIKSELYEEEDAVAAAKARDYFEKGLSAWPRDMGVGAPPMTLRYSVEALT